MMREDGRVMREGFAADFVVLAIPNLKIQVSETVAKPLNLGAFPWFSMVFPESPYVFNLLILSISHNFGLRSAKSSSRQASRPLDTCS